ncbi:MAG: LPS assembly protein LptD [Mariprofundus sp.]
MTLLNRIHRSRRSIPAAITLTAMLLMHATQASAGPVDIDADQVTRSADGIITATGHVIIKRSAETLVADQVIYRSKQHVMEASGHVIIRSANATIKAEAAQLQTQSQTGNIQHAIITLPGGERLQAEQVKRIDDQRFAADHIIYSSCPSDDESWRITASHALLDQEEGSLTTTNPRFELWQTPVLYAPWWRQTFKRKSGLLMPIYSAGKRRGTEVATPYYFAPDQNWDATLTPHWMSARGFMGEAELRHISTIGHERLAAAGINDRVTGRLRGRLQADILWQLPADSSLRVNADHLSDRDYLADFATADDINARYLQSNMVFSQQLQLAELQTVWSLQAQHFQDLLLTSNAATIQILPRLQSSSQWQLNPHLITHFDQQTTRFKRNSGIDGWRMDLHPYIELPWQSAGGSISASLNGGLRHTRYWLQQTALTNRTPTRTAPEVSLEMRSDFERISTDLHWRHLISPVFRYDYVDAPDQSLLPNFDSAVGLLTWDNLLSGNRYSGYDRIEKTNRFALTLESRLQSRAGAKEAARDVLTARAGIAYDILRSSVDPLLQAAPTRPFSNLLGELIWQPVDGISLRGNGQYNPSGHYWSTLYTAINLANQTGTLYAGYQLTDARFSTRSQLIDLKSAVNLGSRWSATARWQYDRLRKLSQQTAIGMQYKHPCWTTGIEAYRTNRSSGNSNSANFGFRILLEIKGLGSVGS